MYFSQEKEKQTTFGYGPEIYENSYPESHPTIQDQLS